MGGRSTHKIGTFPVVVRIAILNPAVSSSLQTKQTGLLNKGPSVGSPSCTLWTLEGVLILGMSPSCPRAVHWPGH